MKHNCTTCSFVLSYLYIIEIYPNKLFVKWSYTLKRLVSFCPTMLVDIVMGFKLQIIKILHQVPEKLFYIWLKYMICLHECMSNLCQMKQWASVFSTWKKLKMKKVKCSNWKQYRNLGFHILIDHIQEK